MLSEGEKPHSIRRSVCLSVSCRLSILSSRPLTKKPESAADPRRKQNSHKQTFTEKPKKTQCHSSKLTLSSLFGAGPPKRDALSLHSDQLLQGRNDRRQQLER